MKKAPLVNESALVTEILSTFKKLGILCWRMPIDGIRAGSSGVRRKNPLTGFPDIAGVYQGQFFALEVKMPKGKLSVEQAQWILDLRDAGAYACKVTSLDEAFSVLKDLEEITGLN